MLVGGGHAHLSVLRAFAMRPEPGVRLTLIADELEVPYSGMLPGWIAGLYRPEECRLDLLRLSTAAGARLIHDAALGLDLAARRVLCRRHPPIRYDVLSLDIGSVARLDLPGAAEHALAVRPIASFEARFEAALARCRHRGGAPPRIAVVGGGAAGVELAMALRHRLAVLSGLPDAQVALLSAAELLPSHGARARRLALRALATCGIAAVERAEVMRVESDAVVLADGRRIGCDIAVWATGAAAAPWLAETGLSLNKAGFVAVDAALRSTSHPEVFAAGDVAAVLPHPRPKAGVYAVRQGQPLAANLRRALRGEEPRPFRPQRKALALVGTGDGKAAIALRGAFAWSGHWIWRLKDRIDRRWIERFRDLPPAMVGPAMAGPMGPGGSEEMRCAGCGGKLPADVLFRVLRRLPSAPRELAAADGPVLMGADTPEDAAVLAPPPAGAALLQTVDLFRAFLGDLHLFGRIAANHALSDIHAMGGRPWSALAIAVLPPGGPERLEEDLHAMLEGAREVLEAAGAQLVGGHSAEGAEAALGFAVTGLAPEPTRLLRKGGLRPGDRLILTKPLGTGVILAAAMRGAARAPWMEAALASMQRPLGPAAEALLAHGATACTDVTGFGLLGHLAEMLRASSPGLEVSLDPAAVPLLPGAAEALGTGHRSTLHDANLAAIIGLLESPGAAEAPEVQALVDPQTAGGLLAAVPADRAEACLLALRGPGGQPEAAYIGSVAEGAPGAAGGGRLIRFRGAA